MINRVTQNAAFKRPIATWRFVAGASIHCLVPAYIVAIACAYFAVGPTPTTPTQVLRFSGLFVAAYAGLTLVAVVTASLIDPLVCRHRERRAERDPLAGEKASRVRVAAAIANGRRLLGDKSCATLEAIRLRPWHHADARYQALSAELAEVVRTSGAAIASASPDRRTELELMAAGTLAHLEVALSALMEEQARLDEGDARVMAQYVRLRHSQSNFTGDPP